MYTYIKEERSITYNGRKIYGNVYLPDCKGKYPIVILSHGYNSSGNDFEREGSFLAAHGIAAYSFDFCGGSLNSRSSLKTTEMTIFTEVEDLKAIIQEAKSWEQTGAIYLFGASQGGFVTALTSAACAEDIQGIFLLFPAFCIPDDWTKKYKSIEDIPEQVELWGMALGKDFVKSIYGFDWKGYIKNYDKEVLIFHGDQDAVVSQNYSLEAEKIYSKAKLVMFPGEGHGFSERGNAQVMQMVLKSIETV